MVVCSKKGCKPESLLILMGEVPEQDGLQRETLGDRAYMIGKGIEAGKLLPWWVYTSSSAPRREARLVLAKSDV